jgi:hypothetical protein
MHHGVPKALSESAVGRSRMLAMSVITTNWIPISAAPDDPTIDLAVTSSGGQLKRRAS